MAIRTVRDALMETVAVAESTTLQDAAARMLDADVEIAVVVVEGETAVAVLTAEDVARGLSRGVAGPLTPVGIVAQRDAPSVRLDDELLDAREQLRAQHREIAIVLGPDGEIAGLIER
jgi:CBS domain-containing protein